MKPAYDRTAPDAFDLNGEPDLPSWRDPDDADRDPGDEAPDTEAPF